VSEQIRNGIGTIRLHSAIHVGTYILENTGQKTN